LAVRDEHPLALVISELRGQILEDTRLLVHLEQAAWCEAGSALFKLHASGSGHFFGRCRRDGRPMEVGSQVRDAKALMATRLEELLYESQRLRLVRLEEERSIRGALELVDAFEAEHPIPCHRDYCAANWLVDEDGGWTGVIDFEFSQWDVRVSDLARDPGWNWIQRPDLFDAFLEGYDRRLSPGEEQQLLVARATYALGAIVWGHQHAFYGFEHEGRQALAHLARWLR
jgi:Ser/Thr protein kinase RdoA (MazF antagonist)